MLQINHIDELRSKVAHKEEIRESDVGEGYKSFCYMIAADGTFDDAWSRECRGIVFDRTGKVAARPLHKFFNVNEREETQVNNLDWSKVVRVMEKRDGSMIHTVKGDWTIGALHGVRIKSKKSFDSDVAKAAWPQFYKYQDFCRMVASLDATAIFEYTAPDARIVLYYPDPELKLLHIRDNVSGKYWDLSKLRSIAELYGVKMVKEVDEFWWQMGGFEGLPFTREFSIEWALEAAETRENIEGWVIQFENGEMVKLKTKWYMARHKAMTFLRERDVAQLVLAGGLDDLKSLLVGDGINIDEILKIETRVIDDIRNIERMTKAFAGPEDFKLDRKSFVMKHKDLAGPYFGMLMNLYSGKTPDYQGFFEKNILKQYYGLRQLVLVPTVAEAD